MKLKTSISVLAGCLVIFLFIMLPVFLSMKSQKDESIAAFKGSDFSLKDMNNNLITEESFEENLTAIFFGFTHCPDVCPTTVLDMAKVLKALGDDSDKVLPIFISVDHRRDDYETVRNYVDFFDKRIAALTSDKENIDKLTKFFKTKYELVDPTKPGFLVEHSSNIYILDKSLQVKKIIPNGIPSEEITIMLKRYL